MLNQAVLKDIHNVLESYDRKYVRCSQIKQVREEKHYTHKEILDIYQELAVKYNKREQEKQTFDLFIWDNSDKFDRLLTAARRRPRASKARKI